MEYMESEHMGDFAAILEALPAGTFGERRVVATNHAIQRWRERAAVHGDEGPEHIVAAFVDAAKLDPAEVPAFLRVRKGVEVRRHTLADGRHVFLIAAVESNRLAIVTVREDTTRQVAANISGSATGKAMDWKAAIAAAKQRAKDAADQRRKSRRGGPERAKYAAAEQRAYQEMHRLMREERRDLHERYRQSLLNHVQNPGT